MIRRSLLLGATALVAACSQPTTVAAWAANASAFSSGVSALVPQIAAITSIPADASNLVQSALKAASGFAATLAQQTDPAKATPLVIQIENGVNSALSALAPFMGLLPQPVSLVLTAAQIILPVIEAAVNPSLVKASAAPAGMTPAEARLVLLGAASAKR